MSEQVLAPGWRDFPLLAGLVLGLLLGTQVGLLLGLLKSKVDCWLGRKLGLRACCNCWPCKTSQTALGGSR